MSLYVIQWHEIVTGFSQVCKVSKKTYNLKKKNSQESKELAKLWKCYFSCILKVNISFKATLCKSASFKFN